MVTFLIIVAAMAATAWCVGRVYRRRCPWCDDRGTVFVGASCGIEFYHCRKCNRWFDIDTLNP